MHPRPLNEKGGNDSMCASIGQQTKEQTTHWSKLQAITQVAPDVTNREKTYHPKLLQGIIDTHWDYPKIMV